jgi:TRAP-type C4-dicarboxylate transport system substrate-binding protein
MNMRAKFHAGTALIGFALLAVPAAAENITLTYSSYNAPTHPMNTDVMIPWFEEVAKVTEGRVTITMLPVMVGEAAGQYDVAADGIADITYFTPGYSPGRFDVSAIGELPLVTDNPLVGAIAYQRFYDEVMAPLGVFDEVHVISMFTTSPGQLFTRKPINTGADLEGLKVRSPLAMTTAFATAFGASPVQRPVTEAYELLSTGVLDGTMSGIDQVIGYHINDVTSYLTIIPGGLYNSACGVVINKDSWERISEEDRAAITAISGEHMARMVGEVYLGLVDAGTEKMKETGTVSIANDDVVKHLADAVPVIEADLFKRIETGGVPNAADLLVKYREIVAAAAAENGIK